MNKPQKLIWTFYLLLIVFGVVSAYYNSGNVLMAILIFGWIPFLIAHFIWKDKKDNHG